MFSRSNKATAKKLLKINGEQIDFSTEVKYLGVTLTNRLRWDRHIKAKINSARAKLILLKMATGLLWGPSPRMVIWAYNSIIIPAVTYAAIVWGHRKFPDAILGSLTRLNRLVLTGLSPVRKSTPTAGLEAIMGLKPLDLAIQEAGLLAFWRWRPKVSWISTGKDSTSWGHIRSWSDRRVPTGIGEQDLNRGTISYNWDPPCTYISTKAARKMDVSCQVTTKRDLGTTHLSIKYVGMDDTSNLLTKLSVSGQEQNCICLGLEQVLMALQPRLKPGQRVGISMETPPSTVFQPFINDLVSRELLGAIAGVGGLTGHKVSFTRDLNRDKTMVVKLDSVASRKPGHKGPDKPGNNQETDQSLGQDRWQARWNKSESCKQTKIWLPTIRTDTPGYFRSLPRTDLGMALQLLTGHNGLRRHTAKLDKSTDVTVCRLCHSGVEDATHLWSNCQATAADGWVQTSSTGRVLLLPSNNTPNVGPGEGPIVWTCSQLSRFLRVPSVAKLLKPDRINLLNIKGAPEYAPECPVCKDSLRLEGY